MLSSSIIQTQPSGGGDDARSCGFCSYPIEYDGFIESSFVVFDGAKAKRPRARAGTIACGIGLTAASGPAISPAKIGTIPDAREDNVSAD